MKNNRSAAASAVAPRLFVLELNAGRPITVPIIRNQPLRSEAASAITSCRLFAMVVLGRRERMYQL